jgi:hypothetical protein
LALPTIYIQLATWFVIADWLKCENSAESDWSNTEAIDWFAALSVQLFVISLN